MAMQNLMLNAFYDAGNNISPYISYLFILLMVVELGYVFIKYVITSNK